VILADCGNAGYFRGQSRRLAFAPFRMSGLVAVQITARCCAAVILMVARSTVLMQYPARVCCLPRLLRLATEGRMQTSHPDRW